MKLRIRANGARLMAILAAIGASVEQQSAAEAPQVAPGPGMVYITLWFDTEDYILPQSDDAAKRIAEMLTRLGVRATFKVVGEKARTLDRRGRKDVIEALKLHEIGYHSNTHSQHPTPAEYEEPLDWYTGVREFTRRERPGFEDVKRIFGQSPSCYGQPGSSWAPQSYGALREWGVGVYLDESNQVGLDGKPFYYGSLLNIFNTREGGQLRANHDWSNLLDAKTKFLDYYRTMTTAGGGVISIFYHPCEFVHREFWDGVNFAKGANPPREEWKLPPMQTPAEQERRYKFLEDSITFLKSFPQVRFVTASEALALYADRAQSHVFDEKEVLEIARAVQPELNYQVRDGIALSPAEIFSLLVTYSANRIRGVRRPLRLPDRLFGPASAGRPETRKDTAQEVSLRQAGNPILDAADFVEKHRQAPNEIWIGSAAVSPESFLVALAKSIVDAGLGGPAPTSLKISTAHLATAKYVAEDGPKLWGWVIFPDGFRAPNLMSLAKLQAWTLKPAILHVK